MSKPTLKAWKAAIHLLAWLQSQRLRGVAFRSDGNLILEATCDASNHTDPKDAKALVGYTMHLAGGPIASSSQKFVRSVSAPGHEYLALYPCATHIIWFRQLVIELGLAEVFLNGPTALHCDNTVAIDWVKFGKVTPGNRGIQVRYREVDDWSKAGLIHMKYVPTIDNRSDLMSKPVKSNVINRLLLWLCGYVLEPQQENVAQVK